MSLDPAKVRRFARAVAAEHGPAEAIRFAREDLAFADDLPDDCAEELRAAGLEMLGVLRRLECGEGTTTEGRS